MASAPKQGRIKLSENESTAAFVIGGGLTLVIIAMGVGTAQADFSRVAPMFLIGALAAIGGTIGWLFVLRPWKNFDDWSTPLYTGHEHDEPHKDEPAADHPPSSAAH